MKKHLILLLTFTLVAQASYSQRNRRQAPREILPDSLYSGLAWRNIGPFRGGRSVAACGVADQPGTYYMGTTGGGIWKTGDNGITWKNISDGFLKTGTVGDIAVAPSDPNVVLAGMGEHAARGVMTSMGDGVYLSRDAGTTWEHIGLDKSRHISDVCLLYTSPSPRDRTRSRMPSSA